MSGPIDIRATVVGAEAVQARFVTAPERGRAVLRGTVQALGIELQARIKAEYLSGQSLRVRSGRLRRSINESTADTGAEITSTVGTNVAYGRVWELGFDGIVAVGSFSRRTSHGEALVRAHQRRMHIEARPFLRPALAESRPHIVERLGAAAKGAV